MKKFSLSFDSYPTDIEESVADELGIEIKEDSIECGLWEEKNCCITFDEISSYSYCEKHSEKVAEVDISWKNWGSKEISHRTEIFYRTPRVLISTNEGGNNSTGVCLDCIEEYLKQK